MTYARLCEHGKYEGHFFGIDFLTVPVNTGSWCPGGSVLPDDTLVIVKEDGEWPEWLEAVVEKATAFDSWSSVTLLNALAAAQGSQE